MIDYQNFTETAGDDYTDAQPWEDDLYEENTPEDEADYEEVLSEMYGDDFEEMLISHYSD